MGMAKADVLDRVAADLARGYTAPAIQRLSSLVAAHPTDLDLRRQLAAVHRMVGNFIEAGRWRYLHLDTAEVARSRLAALADAAGPPTGPRPATGRPRWRLFALALTAPFALIGAVTVVQWLVG